MAFLAIVDPPPRPESTKFPVSSLLAGNLALPETGSLVTPSSSGESGEPSVPLWEADLEGSFRAARAWVSRADT